MTKQLPPWMKNTAFEMKTAWPIMMRVMIAYAAGFTIAMLFVLATVLW